VRAIPSVDTNDITVSDLVCGENSLPFFVWDRFKFCRIRFLKFFIDSLLFMAHEE
jgi:hypothetical protein